MKLDAFMAHISKISDNRKGDITRSKERFVQRSSSVPESTGNGFSVCSSLHHFTPVHCISVYGARTSGSLQISAVSSHIYVRMKSLSSLV